MPEPHSLEDTVMQRRFREIVAEYGIQVIVETGIDKGLSTITLSKMVPTVISIDNNLQCISAGYTNLGKAGVKNALLICDNSPDALRKLQPLLLKETLYFLDAHWQAYVPLRDEIDAIRRGSGVIVVHDVKVPGHPELGYDSWPNFGEFSYENLRGNLQNWSSTHRVEYNEKAECQKPRGCMYVFPK